MAETLFKYLVNQRRLLLLVDGHLRHGVHRQYARIAAHGPVEIAQFMLGGAVDRPGNQRKGHRTYHTHDRGHEGVAHSGGSR